MVELTGAWARERYVKTAPLHEGIQAIYSMRGHSSHQFNPFFALKRPETTEDAGEAIGISLVTAEISWDRQQWIHLEWQEP